MAFIAKQRYKLDIAPRGGWVIVYASQHDDGAREIEFEITNQGRVFSIPASINVSVQGIKSNGSYFSHSCSYSGNIVTMALADDMTDVIGKSICVLKFTNSSQQKLATAKFVLNVDTDSSSEGIIIDTDAEEIFNQMLNDIRAQASAISADIAGLQSMVGTPLVASTVSAMTDHNKIYVYVGSESGYTNGNWYYWNGSAWTSGGVYNAVAFETDTTLTKSGQAADAKKTGDKITNLKGALNKVTYELELVATYHNKTLRKTGMADYNGFSVYQYKVPASCEAVHLISNFYGNVFVIFTDMAENGDFSSKEYQAYPARGYSEPTTIDDDYDTKGFKYVWIPLYDASGITTSATASLVDVVDFISNNSIIAMNITGGLTDFNDAERNHVYVITSEMSSISHYPPVANGGTLLCFAAYNIDNVQIFVSNQTNVFIRRMWGTTWGSWKQIQTDDTIQTIVDTAVSAAFAGYYPYNILSAFKNITCIGDSLTYSQVYTGASASRQAYNPYPAVLAKRCGATETILATPGDTATQAWDRNGANIVQKDAQLTLVYLGTNGGLTDTMDNDMVGDDYTQWANTNTGNYGKIIAKSIAVGSRVVLIKVHSSSGGVAVTNTVIEQMAARFNVPVIGNAYLRGTKYHSYPDGSGTNGTHYNDFGYAVFADCVINSISKLPAEDAVKIIPT